MSRSHLSRSVLAVWPSRAWSPPSAGARQRAPRAPLGRVFMVNPVQSSGDESLTDQKDSATAVPQTQYVTSP